MLSRTELDELALRLEDEGWDANSLAMAFGDSHAVVRRRRWEETAAHFAAIREEQLGRMPPPGILWGPPPTIQVTPLGETPHQEE